MSTTTGTDTGARATIPVSLPNPSDSVQLPLSLSLSLPLPLQQPLSNGTSKEQLEHELHLPAQIASTLATMTETCGLAFPYVCSVCTVVNDVNPASCTVCSAPNPTYSSATAAALLRGSASGVLAELTMDADSMYDHIGAAASNRLSLPSTKALFIVVRIPIDPRLNTKVVADCCIRNARIAIANGADGIFLVPEAAQPEQPTVQTIQCYRAVRTALGHSQFIGIRFLKPATVATASVPTDANALWITDGIDANGLKSCIKALDEPVKMLRERKFRGSLFAGFFYDGLYPDALPEEDEKLEAYVRCLHRHADVLTVHVADVDQLAIREALIRVRIATEKLIKVTLVTDGLSEAGVCQILPYVDYFIAYIDDAIPSESCLIATSDRKLLTPEHIRALADAIHTSSCNISDTPLSSPKL